MCAPSTITGRGQSTTWKRPGGRGVSHPGLIALPEQLLLPLRIELQEQLPGEGEGPRLGAPVERQPQAPRRVPRGSRSWRRSRRRHDHAGRRRSAASPIRRGTPIVRHRLSITASGSPSAHRHARHPGPEDAGLLPGDRHDVVAEHLRVLELDRGDRAEALRHDRRRVQPAAEPDLEHGPVRLQLGEVVERRRREDLEPGLPGHHRVGDALETRARTSLAPHRPSPARALARGRAARAATCRRRRACRRIVPIAREEMGRGALALAARRSA